MRLLTSVIAFVIVLGAVTALVYTGRQNKTGATNIVAVTVNPIYDLVQQVAGSDVPVKLIAPAGANPHSFEARPQDAALIEQSRLIFAIGQDLDNWIINQAASANNRPVVTFGENLDLIVVGDDNSDPHYYLSPKNAQIMVGQIADNLSAYWPEFTTNFAARARSYQQQIEDVITAYQPKFAARQLKIATFHNAFAYLARDFGVDVVTTFEEFPGQSPSPAWLVDFQKKVKENKLSVVYAEPSFPKSSLEPVAKDLNLTIAELDPLENNSRHTDYLSALEDNLETLLSQP
jgi:zinc transport system substrate-binding protein